jgi:hypothetical protein
VGAGSSIDVRASLSYLRSEFFCLATHINGATTFSRMPLLATLLTTTKK